MRERRKENAKELVRQHWDGRADSFDDEGHHGIHSAEQRDAWLSVLQSRIGDEPSRVLDVGCGTGVVSTLLAELGHDVTGVDLSDEMLTRAREKAEAADRSIDFCLGDAEILPVAEASVDLVAVRHLLWTLPSPSKAIREWSRVVRPNGRIVLIEGHWNHSEPRGEYGDVHSELPLYDGRPPDELAEFLGERGLENVECEPLMDPVLWGRQPKHEYYLATGTVPH